MGALLEKAGGVLLKTMGFFADGKAVVSGDGVARPGLLESLFQFLETPREKAALRFVPIFFLLIFFVTIFARHKQG